MAGKSPATGALAAHENRYYRDLAYLLKRLDKMDAVMREQDRIIANMSIKFHELKYGAPETSRSIPAIKARGNCRVIQFSAEWSK